MRPLISPINRPAQESPRGGDLISNCLHHSLCHFHLLVECRLPFPLEFSSSRQLNRNIGTHCLCARENTHKMPPKKKLRKEIPTEGSSQAAGAQVLKTTQAMTQSLTFVDPRIATAETGRPEDPPQQPTQLQETKAQEDQQQDSEEEIDTIIKDELAHDHQENERLRLIQEQMARRKAMAKRAQVMQQQIKQERATRRGVAASDRTPSSVGT
jgi:hypothetical protein